MSASGAFEPKEPKNGNRKSVERACHLNRLRHRANRYGATAMDRAALKVAEWDAGARRCL